MQLKTGAPYNKMKLIKMLLENLVQLQKLRQNDCKSSVERFEEKRSLQSSLPSVFIWIFQTHLIIA